MKRNKTKHSSQKVIEFRVFDSALGTKKPDESEGKGQTGRVTLVFALFLSFCAFKNQIQIQTLNSEEEEEAEASSGTTKQPA